MRTLEDIRRAFSADRFATEAAEISIETAERGHAVCQMPILSKHLNARGTVMGGAIFTLADFTAAVAANGHAKDTNTITLHGDITYLNPAKGKVLTAAADVVKQGKSVALYDVTIRDELGTLIAKASMNGYVLNMPFPVEKST
ncbi:MAG: PaaI family thioesterase [Oscillospiraceae bacterium]|nr:PaaI family thioesterase [Oscillospiraceae bacterium]